jgi:hypothetical protein
VAQKRGRKIAMSDEELDAFLTEERTARVASVGTSGPHVTPLWFVWHDHALWLYSLTRSQRWADIVRTPRLAAVIDAGHDYVELRGAEITGDASVVGEVPRVGDVHDRLAAVEQRFARKYASADALRHDGRHAWLRVEPAEIRSWDFRKLGS